MKDRAIILMADGLILFWIVIGGSLTPVLRKRPASEPDLPRYNPALSRLCPFRPHVALAAEG